MDTAINFNHHATTITDASFTVLGTTTRITLSFFKPFCFLRLFSSMVSSRVQCTSPVWNCIGVTNSSVIEHVQHKFICVLFNSYFQPNYF